jgi:acyl-CoA hydrolase
LQTRKKAAPNHRQRKEEKAEEIEVLVEEIDETLVGRPVRDSQSEMAELVLPNDANPLGALLGGRLMHWIDLAGAMAVHRHARSYAVTASVDHIDFLVPVRVGDLVILRSSVNRVFHTSVEVGVKVFVENYIADTAQHVASAYLTFVAIDREGNRLRVAPVVPETDEQRRRYDDAGRRRESRRSEVERRKAKR